MKSLIRRAQAPDPFSPVTQDPTERTPDLLTDPFDAGHLINSNQHMMRLLGLAAGEAVDHCPDGVTGRAHDERKVLTEQGLMTTGAREHMGHEPEGSRNPKSFAQKMRADIDGSMKAVHGDEARPEGFKDALQNASLTELSMLSDLQDHGLTQEGMVEVLEGTHVRVDDGGDMARDWRETTRRVTGDPERPGGSSHYPDTGKDESHLEGRLLHENLFGRATAEGSKTEDSWMQLENAPTSEKAAHTCDFLQYCKDGLNQGPWGASAHTETHKPLLLKPTASGEWTQTVDKALTKKITPGKCAQNAAVRGVKSALNTGKDVGEEALEFGKETAKGTPGALKDAGEAIGGKAVGVLKDTAENLPGPSIPPRPGPNLPSPRLPDLSFPSLKPF